jgi:hypothetical protein
VITPELVSPALVALQKLLIQAKARAYGIEMDSVGDFLGEFELIPEILADGRDRTEELVATIRGIAEIHPGCRGIADDFERSITAHAGSR